MVRVEPVQVQVRADWFDGRPREITWNARRVPITEVVGVRDETAAFPVVVGPRTIFEVDTPLARLQLSYRHRTRRWSIESMEAASPPSAMPSLRAPRPRSRTTSALGRVTARDAERLTLA